SIRSGRRALHAEESESRETVEAPRRHGRQARRVEPDDVDLRGGARLDPRAESALVQGAAAPVPRGVLQAEHDAARHVLDRMDGVADRRGGVRVGCIADLLVVNGNPLENLRVMNPYGTDLMSYNGQIIDNYSGIVKPGDPNVKSVHGGGIEWTIKDGIPYHVP